MIPPFTDSGNLPEGICSTRLFLPSRTGEPHFGGELFPAEWGADPDGTRFLDYFQHDKSTGERKGIVALALKGLP